MSGVGPPAMRPRNLRRGRHFMPGFAAICLGLGPQLLRPRPHAWRRRPGGYHMSGLYGPETCAWRRRPHPLPHHMSGVGAPAVRPRTVARARRGLRNGKAAPLATLICLGLGPQLLRPRNCKAGLAGPLPVARARKRPPGPQPTNPLWVSYTAPPC
eukprot:gene13527-biopygen18560